MVPIFILEREGGRGRERERERKRERGGGERDINHWFILIFFLILTILVPKNANIIVFLEILFGLRIYPTKDV